MTEIGQGVSSAWNERRRLIRLRRKKERSNFWAEFKIVPPWLKGTVAVLYVIALVIATAVNIHNSHNPNGNDMFPWELRENPALASLALAGIVTATSIVMAAYLFMVGYVYRDAKRRAMNAGLWTLLVLVLSPAYLLVGFIIYFLVREPLPYPCPKCNNLVGPRFNFCPNCKCNLQPSCPNCKKEIAETDNFCPYCATELKPAEPNGTLATESRT
jgi:double zinc ribbon protein